MKGCRLRRFGRRTGARLCLLACLCMCSCRHPTVGDSSYVEVKPGLQGATAWIRSFVETKTEVYHKNVNSVSLQKWVTKWLRVRRSRGGSIDVSLRDIPKTALPDSVKSDFYEVNAVLDERQEQDHMMFVGGGGRGWYGLAVGSPNFKLADGHIYYLELCPGVYVYFVPGL